MQHPVKSLGYINSATTLNLLKAPAILSDTTVRRFAVDREDLTTERRLKVVPATFLLICFVCLKDSTCETRKNVFYFTSKALFVLEIIRF